MAARFAGERVPRPLLPCLFPGCRRWFKNQTGLKCHARTHSSSPTGKGDNGSLDSEDDDTTQTIDDLINSMSEDSSNGDDVKYGEYKYVHV
jgi:hypothetical protein